MTTKPVHVWRKYTKLWRFEHGIPPIHFAKLIGRGRRRAAVDFLCLSKREFRSLEEMDVTNGCELFGIRCNVPLTEVPHGARCFLGLQKLRRPRAGR